MIEEREDTTTEETEQVPGSDVAADVAPTLSDTQQDGFVPVMEIDPDADEDTIAAERAEAEEKGLKVVMKSKATTSEEEEEDDADEEDGQHPLRSRLLGTDKEEVKKEVKVSKPVKEWFAGIGVQDPVKLVTEELPALRTRTATLEQELGVAKKDLEYISRLSPEAMNVIQMDLEKKDWKQVLARPSVDFKLPFEKQDPQAMAASYAKDKISQQDWEEYNGRDCDPRTKMYVEAVLDKAKMLYEKDQDESNNYISNRAKENQERTKKYNESVELAVSNLLASVPGAQAQEKRIRGFLTPDAVLGMFFNNDGTLKTDAPENLWLVADREAILSGKAQRIKEKVEQDASRDRLKRTSEKAVAPKRGSGAVAKDKETTGLQKARSVLDSLGF